MGKKAIVLLSGGLHSTTALAVAKSRDCDIYAITFDYGQKSKSKLEAARKMAAFYSVKEHKTVSFDLSALLPENHPGVTEGNPVLPSRNNIYLAFALSYAEMVQADNIFIGINSIDYGDRPDCRSAFIHEWEKMANAAMQKRGIRKLDIWSPLMNTATPDIIKKGMELGVPYGDTISCLHPDDFGAACGECLSCEYRRAGFAEAGVPDPTRYRL